MRTNDDLVDDVERRGKSYLGGKTRSPEVIAAMRRVDRAYFLPDISPVEAYSDRALPIGWGQTCSEPSMVAFMLDMLEISGGERILEIGAGSGYAAAIAALLCGPAGKVYACEMVDNLVIQMRANLNNWKGNLRNRSYKGIADIEILHADGSAGFPHLAPFDRIFLSAGIWEKRDTHRGFSELVLLKQLSEEGVLLYPERYGSLFRIQKLGSRLIRDQWTGVAFVPLKGENT